MHRVVDSGLPPSASPHAAGFPWPAQRELAVVLYAPNAPRHVETKGAPPYKGAPPSAGCSQRGSGGCP